MVRNSRLAVRIVVVLLFAIIGHEALMAGAHASSPTDHRLFHASHTMPEPVVESSPSSIRVAEHGDAGDCAPGHDFVRRVNETVTIDSQVDSTAAYVLLPASASSQGLAGREEPGSPPGQRRALLQVFLN